MILKRVSFQVMILPIVSILLTIILLFTSLYWLSLAYLSWIFYDVVLKQTSKRAGRRWGLFRRSIHWRYFRDYFPINLVKTAELESSKNYIFGYHPHGVLGCGALCNFGTEATDFSKVFPGLTPHLCTLKENFKLPIIRGLLLWMGAYMFYAYRSILHMYVSHVKMHKVSSKKKHVR